LLDQNGNIPVEFSSEKVATIGGKRGGHFSQSLSGNVVK